MTPEQRLKASIDQTIHYFNCYAVDWRLIKVLTNQKLLKEKYSFFAKFDTKLYDKPKDNFEATIAQEINNGLYFDSIAQCVQYIEDLFAFIRASKKPDYFIRQIVSYSAGEVTNAIKGFKVDKITLSKAFFIPAAVDWATEEEQFEYDTLINAFINMVSELVTFYINCNHFYNQYKHGLAVGMRPFGNVYTDEQINQDKEGKFNPYLTVYDNMNLKASLKRGTFNIKHGVMMPGLTENVTPFLSELEQSNNFLRLVFPPDIPDFSFALLLEIAYKARTCINAFIYNYISDIQKTSPKKFQIPIDPISNTVSEITVQ